MANTTPIRAQSGQPQPILVDLFAGGGGMSTSMEMAWGRGPDIAINHSDQALSLHRANHPQTRHFIADVFEIDPRTATHGRPVGWLHLSPDCTHHSQAAGGQPRSKKIRGLAWVGVRWAGQALPSVISVENVKQILAWGPLIAKRDKATGRVVTLDKIPNPKTGREEYRVAAKGERVPVQNQYLVPDPKKAGRTWRFFIRSLEKLGYVTDWRILCAADFGGHTTRERLFMLARRDGQAIRWPEPTHAKNPTSGQKPWKAAADCLDFSLPCPSIFSRKKPLAEATLRRIARGIMKYVVDNPAPYIVKTRATEDTDKAPVFIQAGHGEGTPGAHRWSYGANDIQGPVGTITASGGGQALAAASLVQTGYGERPGQAPRALNIKAPLGTCVGTTKHALATAYLMQANGGFNTTPGHELGEPVSTVTNTGSQQQLVTGLLSSYYTDEANRSRGLESPTATITTENRFGFVECRLSPDHQKGASLVAAFLMRYYGEGGQWSDLNQPMTTVTTKDRMALVTVQLDGTPFVLVDIGLRMLTPRELFRAQDFPDSYIIDHGHDGRQFSKAAQVRMCGNSVDPLAAVGFLKLNAPWLSVREAAVA